MVLRISFLVATLVTFRGLSPSMVKLSSFLKFLKEALRKIRTPHIYFFSEKIRFALYRFRSPLITVSLLISLPPGTKMFQFPGFPFSFENVSNETGIPIRQSSNLRLLAPPRSISQLGTVFIGARAEPSIKWPTYCNNPSLSNPLLTFINPKKGFQSFPCDYISQGA